MTASANAKAVLRSLAFPRKARVLHALGVLVIYGREHCTKCDAIRDFPLSFPLLPSSFISRRFFVSYLFRLDDMALE